MTHREHFFGIFRKFRSLHQFLHIRFSSTALILMVAMTILNIQPRPIASPVYKGLIYLMFDRSSTDIYKHLNSAIFNINTFINYHVKYRRVNIFSKFINIKQIKRIVGFTKHKQYKLSIISKFCF